MKLSLIALSLASITARPFAAAASDESHAILDLSKDLEFAPNFNESPGALAVLAAAEADPGVLTTMVIEDGKIVASYVRDGVDPDEPILTMSITKSLTSLLYGILVDEGFLESVYVTLGEIFTDESDWEGVPDVESRKNITIKDMLSMTSGLIEEWGMGGWSNCPLGDYCNNGLNFFLRDPSTGTRGRFSYLVHNDILGFAFTKLTGVQPRDFLADRVLAPLGIGGADIDWLPFTACDLTNPMYTGLHLTAMQMAKIGLLHLARGAASPGKRVVSSDWIDEMFTEHSVIEEYHPANPETFNGLSYGYQAWLVDFGETGYARASGGGGQYICVGHELGRVTVQQRDRFTPQHYFILGEEPADVGMDPSLAFDGEGSSIIEVW